MRKTFYGILAACAVAGFSQAAFALGDTEYDAIVKQADTDLKAAKQSCSSLSGNAEDVCKLKAEADHTRTVQRAKAAQKNTPEARAEASEKIADADYKLAKEKCDDLSGNAKDVCVQQAKTDHDKAKADYKAAEKGTPEARHDAIKDKAEADYKLAKEKCDSLAGNAKDVCVQQAKADYDKAKANVKAAETGTPAARQDAMRERNDADYKVAKEKCDSLSGDAKDTCVKQAKQKYNQ